MTADWVREAVGAFILRRASPADGLAECCDILDLPQLSSCEALVREAVQMTADAIYGDLYVATRLRHLPVMHRLLDGRGDYLSGVSSLRDVDIRIGNDPNDDEAFAILIRSGCRLGSFEKWKIARSMPMSISASVERADVPGLKALISEITTEAGFKAMFNALPANQHGLGAVYEIETNVISSLVRLGDPSLLLWTLASTHPLLDGLEQEGESLLASSFSGEFGYNAKMLITAAYAGCKVAKWRPMAQRNEERALRRIVNGDEPDVCSATEVKVATEMEQLRRTLSMPRATEICIALQALALPALLTVHIVDEACFAADLLRFDEKWRIAVAVKHFRQIL